MINRNKKNTLLLALAVFSLCLPSIAKAVDIASYKLEQGIPFIGGAGQTLSYGDFSALFQKFITAVYIIAAVAAFIKIFLAGLKWYTSGGSSKAISQSREDIKNALIGLAFLFLAGTLLVFINPNLNKLSKIFNPHGGTQCIQGVTSSETAVGNLSKIGSSEYYAQIDLVSKLNDSGVKYQISTGCRVNSSNSCNPNYCGSFPYTCSPCLEKNIDNCAPIAGNSSCHFNGNCIDITVSDNGYSAAITKLNNWGLDVLDETGQCKTSLTTGDHLHVSLPGTFTSQSGKPGCIHTYSFNPNP